MDILELLRLRGLDDKNKRIKLVRHQDPRCDVQDLYLNGFLEEYQSYQAHHIFSNCDQIVTFLGLKKSMARFVGVYQVSTGRDAQWVPLSAGFPIDHFLSMGDTYYPLEKVSGFDDLLGRVIIDWGGLTESLAPMGDR
jgi:hypothetical protein